MFTLRPATAADQSTINKLVRGARLNPRHLEWPHFVLAVDEAGQIVGCGQIRPHAGGIKELASLVTVKAWRGRGVGQAIVDHLKAQAGRPLWLVCASDMVPFYTRFGFEEIPPGPRTPAHFTRIRRFARIFMWITRYDGYLAVMAWGER